MSVDVITNGTTTLTLTDSLPVLVGRYNDRGPQVAVAPVLGGGRVIVEYDTTASDSMLTLRFVLLTLAQANTLATLIDAGGLVTITLTPGGTPFAAKLAGRDAHTIEPFLDKPHPDSDLAGAALDPVLTRYRADIVAYRV